MARWFLGRESLRCGSRLLTEDSPMTRPVSIATDLTDGLLLSVGALVCYALLRQEAFINEDARVFVNSVGLGLPLSDVHPWYSAIAGAFTALVVPLGVSVFRSLELLSALGTTVGVFCFRRSLWHLQPDRRRRNLTAALCAFTPAVVFFATVVEIPGLLLAFAGASWWLTARCCSRPSWGRAVALGASTAVATMVHGTGHLLAGVAVAFLWTWPASRPVPRLRVACLVLGAHAAVFVALAVFLAGGARRGSLDVFLGLDWWPVEYFAIAAGREWLLPFFPLSVLAIACLWSKRGRIPALAFLALALLYIGVTYVILPGTWERGTYAVPLVYFGATLVGAHVTTRVLGWSVIAALIAAVVLVKEHDRAPPDLLPAEVIVGLASERMAIFVVAGVAESDAVLRVAPHIPVLRIGQLVASPLPPETLYAQFDQIVDASTAAGDGVCLSQGALDLVAASRPAFHHHVLERYELREVRSGSFVAYRLVRRE